MLRFKLQHRSFHVLPPLQTALCQGGPGTCLPPALAMQRHYLLLRSPPLALAMRKRRSQGQERGGSSLLAPTLPGPEECGDKSTRQGAEGRAACASLGQGRAGERDAVAASRPFPLCWQPGTGQMQVGKARRGVPPTLMPAETVCSEGAERGRRQCVAAPNTCGCCDACTKHRVVSERCCSALQAESSARAESCAESQLWCSDVLGRAMETGWKWNEFRD